MRKTIGEFFRFLSKVKIVGDCWEWQGRPTAQGYGRFYQPGSEFNAHRAAHAFFKGDIPDGYVIDHLCRNRMCVNPEHLEIVTYRENARRGIKGVLTTHCPKGHAYDEANTNWYLVDGRCWRRCRACRREKQRVYEAAKREARRAARREAA